MSTSPDSPIFYTLTSRLQALTTTPPPLPTNLQSTWPRPSPPPPLPPRPSPNTRPINTTHTASRRTRSTRPQTRPSTRQQTSLPLHLATHICPSPATRASTNPGPPSASPLLYARLRGPPASLLPSKTRAQSPTTPTHGRRMPALDGLPTTAASHPSLTLATKTCRASTVPNPCLPLPDQLHGTTGRYVIITLSSLFRPCSPRASTHVACSVGGSRVPSYVHGRSGPH